MFFLSDFLAIQPMSADAGYEFTSSSLLSFVPKLYSLLYNLTYFKVSKCANVTSANPDRRRNIRAVYKLHSYIGSLF